MEYCNTEMRCVLKVLFWMAINFFEIKTKEKKWKYCTKLKWRTWLMKYWDIIRNVHNDLGSYKQRRDPKPFLCQVLKVWNFSQLFFKKSWIVMVYDNDKITI